jgi:DNA repair protein RecO (recombination protein O)
MLHQTRGIAVHTVKFSETSIIAKIYTEAFGLQSYLIKGVRRQHSKIKPGLFQPLTILDLTVYHKEKRTLQIIKEVHNHYPYQTLASDIQKSSVALFINELIYKSIGEEERNPELFGFFYRTCIALDHYDGPLAFVPLSFMIHLSRYLGILPQIDLEEYHDIFNLRDGVFQSRLPDHTHFIEPPLTHLLKHFLRAVEDAEGREVLATVQFPATAAQRSELLEQMLVYYKLHLSGFRDVNSHRILHTVLA